MEKFYPVRSSEILNDISAREVMMKGMKLCTNFQNTSLLIRNEHNENEICIWRYLMFATLERRRKNTIKFFQIISSNNTYFGDLKSNMYL